MGGIHSARRLRRAQTDEEKELWQALKAGRFAGFKFRRQHPEGNHILDFYCHAARLSIELDGFQHGLPEGQQRDRARTEYLASRQIEELRFWNHEWTKNRESVLLAIWESIQRRTGCIKTARNPENRRFLPPEPGQVAIRKRNK